MTMRYAHPTPENKRKAVNVLASVFSQEKDIIKLQKYERLDNHNNILKNTKGFIN